VLKGELDRAIDRKLHREGAGASRAHKSTDLKSLSPGWRDGGTEAQLGILAGSCFTRMYGPVWVIRYRSLVASPDAMSEVARKLT
jgi:hypothetical protein